MSKILCLIFVKDFDIKDEYVFFVNFTWHFYKGTELLSFTVACEKSSKI